MVTKTCCMCKMDLPVSEYKSNKKRKDGLQSQCIGCHREYRRRHYLDNRKKYIDKAGVRKREFLNWWKGYKSQFRCERCGESHPACIQFHHIDDNKEKGVSAFVNDGCREKVLKEIVKCVPLCANCHFKEHWREIA